MQINPEEPNESSKLGKLLQVEHCNIKYHKVGRL